MTQANLGNALFALGEMETATTTLAEAVEAYEASLQEFTRERNPLDWAGALACQGVNLSLIAERTSDPTVAETAVNKIETAFETLRVSGHSPWETYCKAQLPKARAVRERLKKR